uniref:Uncharacterized protein n=2 Tax=Parascaris univalens TaxID=6257 RepID=A0A915AUH0_PARUN
LLSASVSSPITNEVQVPSESRMRYKAVIFDMGGVLVSYVKMPYIVKFYELVKNDSVASKAWIDLEKGITTVRDNNDIFASLLDKYPEMKEEVQKGMTSSYILSIFDNMVEDPNFAVAVPNIRKAGFRTAVLTNNAFRDEQKKRSVRLEKALEIHDAVIESCREGIRKPEKEIYLLAASRLNVKPKECVFLDDLSENCDGARAVGMTAIQEYGNDSLSAIRELEKLLEHSFL